MIPYLDLPIVSTADIARARAAVLQVAIEHRLDDSARGRVAVIVTGMATHLAERGIEGRMLIGCHASEDGAQVEVIAMERGTGDPELARQVRDEERAAGAELSGLALARRLASDFGIFSAAGQGTLMLARSWLPVPRAAATSSPATRFSHAGISLAAPGQPLSRNAWHVHIGRDGAEVVVVDAACEGGEGARVAAVVTDAFRRHRLRPADRLRHVHPLMRGTCGGSVAAASLDSVAGTVVFSGVGDLSARIVSIDDDRVLDSAPGRVGDRPPEPCEQTDAWPRDSVVVLHSRGLRPSWTFDGVEPLLRCDPALIAAWLLRGYRQEQDVVVLVLKRV